MSKKPSKGSTSAKSPPPVEQLDASAPVEPATSAQGTASSAPNPSTARLLTLVRRWFPVAGIVIAIGLGFTQGIAVAILALAGTAMLVAVAAIWESLQVLAGDRPADLDGALQQNISGGESEQKAFLLRALKDLEFERSLGKISEQDYEDLKRSYRARAKEVLQELDKRNEAARAEAERMAADWLRSRGLVRIDAGAPKAARQQEERDGHRPDAAAAEELAAERRRKCGSCGADNDGDALFCKKCGSSMKEDAVAEPAARSDEA